VVDVARWRWIEALAAAQRDGMRLALTVRRCGHASPRIMTQPTPITPTTPTTEEGLKVLIAEDDPDARQGLETAVRLLGHSCAVACDGLEAWEMHQADRADVILADWNMPRLDGVGLCQRIRSIGPNVAYTHFVFITGTSDKAHFIEAMHAGADDFLTKPVDLDNLRARLEVARRAVTIQRQGEAKHSALRRKSDGDFRAARTDPLTAVSNRLELTEDLQVLASRVDKYGHPYSAALSDIDSFKAYNDCFGHLAGDDVLRRVAHTIHAGLRRGDGFYRFGGEEFLAILPEQSLVESAAGMDRVRHEVEELHIIHAPQASMPFVTISVGIAELNPDSTGGIEDWLRRADAALYFAKALGRNRVSTEGGAGAQSPLR
jgi:two-component system cell cycle response regulator